MSINEPIVTGDVPVMRHKGLREFVFCSGNTDAVKPVDADCHASSTEASAPSGDNVSTQLRVSHRESHPSRIKTSTIISLIAASRAADRDIEQFGILSAVTIDMIRDALAEADAS